MIPGIVAGPAPSADGVQYVGSGAEVYAVGTAVSAAPPSALQAGDLMVAVVMHRSTLAMPTGWTLADSQDCSGSGVTQSTSVCWRIAASDDLGQSVTWTQAESVRIGALILALRSGAGSAAVIATSKLGESNKPSPSNIYAVAPITGTASGQVAVAACSFVLSTTGADVSLNASDGWSLAMPATFLDRRLAIAFAPISAGQLLSGEIVSTVDGSSPNGVASVSALVGLLP